MLGDYLAAVLNSERMQHKLNLIGAGATITSIPKKELQELQINVPSIKDQQRFMEVYGLLERDVELTEKLLRAKKTLKRGVVSELLSH